MSKLNSDPFVKRSTLRFLTRGETPSVRAVALQLHFGMVTAMREGDGSIHATWKEVADWSGVSYASVKRAVIRLRELGWVKELSGHRIVFDYRRSRPIEKAQIEPSHNIELETLREGCTPSEATATTSVPEPLPSGEDGSREKSFGQALKLLLEAGVDRGGAVVALREARRTGPLNLEHLRQLVAAVGAMPTKPYRPGGLICAAVKRPELGTKLLRDVNRVSRVPGGVTSSGRRHEFREVSPPETPWEAMRRTVRDWLDLVDLADPDDRAAFLSQAMARGWNLLQLRTLPELQGKI